MSVIQVDPELAAINDALARAVHDRKVAQILFSITRDDQTKDFLLTKHYDSFVVVLPSGTSPLVFVAIACMVSDAYDYGVRRGREGIAANIRDLLQVAAR
jgi:hypothetical protein